MNNEPVKLTALAKGAGCGCKIAPAALEEILRNNTTQLRKGSSLLIGNESRDDAAAYDLGNGLALVSTTDFFTPVVDDPFDFGRIAAANAISDVYAMGGKPVLALAILGWPLERLGAAMANRVIEGARETCSQAGIQLAGGHSIEISEPVFGLAVNGIAPVAALRRNNTSHEGDLIFLTKPLGSGILSTAMKRGQLQAPHLEDLLSHITRLNDIGAKLGSIDGVTAMTDVTGFGLLGHLLEMCEGSSLTATLDQSRIREMKGVADYTSMQIYPDATFRNWNAYGSKCSFADGADMNRAFSLFADPQTNGGLLFTASPPVREIITELFEKEGLNDHAEPIGIMTAGQEKAVHFARAEGW